MNTRKFALLTGSGTRIDLNGENGISFTDPQGIGTSVKPTTAGLGNGFFIKIAPEVFPEQMISGTLTFTGIQGNGTVISGGCYGQYKDFVDAVLASGKLYLLYKPDSSVNGTEYRCEVTLDYITKTERRGTWPRGTWLPCTVSFKMLTPWFMTRGPIPAIKTSSDLSTIFTASLDEVAGHIPAGLEVTAGTGNPPLSIILTQSGEIEKSMSFVDTELSGAFRFSSEYKNCGATIGESDLMNYAFTEGETPFLRPVPGKAAVLTVIYIGGAPLSVAVKIFEYYRTV